MSINKIGLVLSGIFGVFSLIGCQNSTSNTFSVNVSNQKTTPSISNVSAAAASPTVEKSNSADSKTSAKTASTPSNNQNAVSVSGDWAQAIRNSLGELFVANDFKPSSIEADFNGDGVGDRVFVVKVNKTSNNSMTWSKALPRLSSNLNIKNMTNGFAVSASPRADASVLEKNKARLVSKDEYALLIVHGSAQGVNSAIADDQTNNKFLLLNSVFPADFEDKSSAPDLISVVLPDNSCKPKQTRGAAIFSGDPESGGKVIFFNGKNYNWKQCGD